VFGFFGSVGLTFALLLKLIPDAAFRAFEYPSDFLKRIFLSVENFNFAAVSV
jgi:hypothetical protein